MKLIVILSVVIRLIFIELCIPVTIRIFSQFVISARIIVQINAVPGLIGFLFASECHEFQHGFIAVISG